MAGAVEAVTQQCEETGLPDETHFSEMRAKDGEGELQPQFPEMCLHSLTHSKIVLGH